MTRSLNGGRQAAFGESGVDPAEAIGDMNPYKFMQKPNGGSSVTALATGSFLEYDHTDRNAGRRPKNATKVKNEMIKIAMTAW